MAFSKEKLESTLKSGGHVPALICLQIIFIALFARFVVYDPNTAVHSSVAVVKGQEMLGTYAMFQDVHVMIFIGFGFLMTFLKKYGLSAVSLNMLIAVITIQWAVLIYGFLHFHTTNPVTGETYSSPGVIFLNLTESLLYSDFCAATILISFGVVIGKTTPLQLIAMALIEVVLFFLNEVIGRKLLGAIDAGDTIFVHTFGAYFGLGASLLLRNKNAEDNQKQGSSYNSDLFSMIGTVFLWLFWPSFNSVTALPGDAQHRAIMNTYFSLCGCVMAAFATSAMLNDHKKFVMEHIQNATLAGGVAIGAVADLMVGPWAALFIGCCAGFISVAGYDLILPKVQRYLKIHDTCGVHNLHGMPGVFGSLVSCIVVSYASKDNYGDSLNGIFAYIGKDGFTAANQAQMQLAALAVTLAIALVGGAFTGFVMRLVGKLQGLEDLHKGEAVVRLAMTARNGEANDTEIVEAGTGLLAADAFYEDRMFFEVHEEEKPIQIYVKDKATGNLRKFNAATDSATNL